MGGNRGITSNLEPPQTSLDGRQQHRGHVVAQAPSAAFGAGGHHGQHLSRSTEVGAGGAVPWRWKRVNSGDGVREAFYGPCGQS